MNDELARIADIILQSKHTVVFTGAGISAESGIPPFRGENGVWSRYDPAILELSNFIRNPQECWPFIRTLFYDAFSRADPNPAHLLLAGLEAEGIIGPVITQNIDNLHQRAGSREVVEYHGNSRKLVCLDCAKEYEAADKIRETPVPRCSCGGLCKPDFVFFGEMIDPEVARRARAEAVKCDVMLIVGTTGEVYPAARIPFTAKERGAYIIEINPEPSAYTGELTDLFLRARAVEAALGLASLLPGA